MRTKDYARTGEEGQVQRIEMRPMRSCVCRGSQQTVPFLQLHVRRGGGQVRLAKARGVEALLELVGRVVEEYAGGRGHRTERTECERQAPLSRVQATKL